MIAATRLDTAGWQEVTRALTAYVGRRAANRADRDDIVQDVLLRMLARIGELRDPKQLGA